MSGTFVVDHDGSPLTGSIDLDGGKHSFVQTLAGAAMGDSGQLLNCPDHADARVLREVLALVFEVVEFDVDGKLTFGSPIRGQTARISETLSSRSRSVFSLLPALLHHARSVVLESSPMGCSIGERPWSWYVDVLREFGVDAKDLPDGLHLRWRRRSSATVTFPYPTMTGSVIAIAAASVCPGTSLLANLSVEPTIKDQLGCLVRMGVVISGKLPALSITGRSDFDTAMFEIGPDRIHAVSYLCAGLLTRGQVTVRANRKLEIPRFLEYCAAIGAELAVTPTAVTAGFPQNREWLYPATGVTCGSEPLFSSDWAAPAMLLTAVRAQGTSDYTDNVFAQRFQFVDVLPGLVSRKRTVQVAGRAATCVEVNGPWRWRGAEWSLAPPSDIRGAVACVLAGLVSPGRWVVRGDHHVNRGHADLARDLSALGAVITHEAKGTD